jgi:hypothetical protein
MNLLTAIMGKTNSNRNGNAHITEQLRTEDIHNQTEGNRFRRFGYVKRIDEHRTPKTLLQKLTEKTPSGRLRTQWLNQVNRNTERKGQSWGR